MATSQENLFELARRELVTVRDLIRFAVSVFNEGKLFFGHGSADAFDEAAYLVLHTLKLPPDKLDPFFDARLTSIERDAVLNVIERRVMERIPAAYLTNEAWLGAFKLCRSTRDRAAQFYRRIVARRFVAMG